MERPAVCLSAFSALFFVMLLPNKFVFGMWPYYEELQMKFDFGYSCIILRKLWPLDLENFSVFTVFHTFLAHLAKG